MPIIVRGSEIEIKEIEKGVTIQSLLSPQNTGSDNVFLNLMEFAKGSLHNILLDEGAFGWLQVLEGSGVLTNYEVELEPHGVTYMPLGYEGGFKANEDSTKLLVAIIPNARRFDNQIKNTPNILQTTDWSNEPVLKSEHDERTRIYMATRTLTGTEAYRGEMIRYPIGTAAPEHHHEGAEHFQYVLKGSGTAVLAGVPCNLCAGDVLYNFDKEAHSFNNDGTEEFIFVEFFVPGSCKTVWAPGANVCAWLPTNQDIMGRTPSRNIAYHVHGEDKGI
jgi:quercetin dioxygenase-like cupin family protein|tara:strand:- start:376 stop:1203 length:828 start_codon:yes stop_codon:yes gene_type:complete